MFIFNGRVVVYSVVSPEFLNSSLLMTREVFLALLLLPTVNILCTHANLCLGQMWGTWNS
jgi:hypothetical protein